MHSHATRCAHTHTLIDTFTHIYTHTLSSARWLQAPTAHREGSMAEERSDWCPGREAEVLMGVQPEGQWELDSCGRPCTGVRTNLQDFGHQSRVSCPGAAGAACPSPPRKSPPLCLNCHYYWVHQEHSCLHRPLPLAPYRLPGDGKWGEENQSPNGRCSGRPEGVHAGTHTPPPTGTHR